MADLYNIYISPRKGVTRNQIEEKMNFAIDWFRNNDNNWIVYTTSDAKKWHSRLKGFINDGGTVLIFKLDTSDYWGHMPKNLWPWLKEKKNKMK